MDLKGFLIVTLSLALGVTLLARAVGEPSPHPPIVLFGG